jgi:hypothetical protein
MAAIHTGVLRLNQLNRQPGDTITFKSDGGAEAKVTYRANWASTLPLCPKKYSPHPDFPWLLLTNWSIEREEGDVGKIDATYEGVQSAGSTDNNADLPAPESELSTSVSQEPIWTHPRYKDAFTIDQKGVIIRKVNAASKQDYDAADITDTTMFPTDVIRDLAMEIFKKLQNGVTSYFVPTTVYSRTYASIAAPSSIDKVGTIDTPTGAPKLDGKRQWLKMSKTWRRAGGYYQIQEQWKASGPAGIDKQLYSS